MILIYLLSYIINLKYANFNWTVIRDYKEIKCLHKALNKLFERKTGIDPREIPKYFIKKSTFKLYKTLLLSFNFSKREEIKYDWPVSKINNFSDKMIENKIFHISKDVSPRI